MWIFVALDVLRFGGLGFECLFELRSSGQAVASDALSSQRDEVSSLSCEECSESKVFLKWFWSVALFHCLSVVLISVSSVLPGLQSCSTWYLQGSQEVFECVSTHTQIAPDLEGLRFQSSRGRLDSKRESKVYFPGNEAGLRLFQKSIRRLPSEFLSLKYKLFSALETSTRPLLHAFTKKSTRSHFATPKNRSVWK